MSFERDLLAILPRLRRFAASLSHDRADGDDLCQAALEKGLRARDQWQPGTRLDSWMYRIMRNLWIDEGRARQRAARTFAPEEAGADVGYAGDKAVELSGRWRGGMPARQWRRAGAGQDGIQAEPLRCRQAWCVLCSVPQAGSAAATSAAVR